VGRRIASRVSWDYSARGKVVFVSRYSAARNAEGEKVVLNEKK